MGGKGVEYWIEKSSHHVDAYIIWQGCVVPPEYKQSFQTMPVKIKPSYLVLFLILSLAGCSSTQKLPIVVPDQTSLAKAKRKAVVNYALTLQGFPYRWGKESPNEGFDCSGFVQHVYAQYGLRLPRTARQMASHLAEIDKRTRQPGDLVFFNTTGEPYSHVGIYIGDNAFVHSSSMKGQVIVSAITGNYWLERLLGFRRPGFWETSAQRR